MPEPLAGVLRGAGPARTYLAVCRAPVFPSTLVENRGQEPLGRSCLSNEGSFRIEVCLPSTVHGGSRVKAFACDVVPATWWLYRAFGRQCGRLSRACAQDGWVFAARYGWL